MESTTGPRGVLVDSWSPRGVLVALKESLSDSWTRGQKIARGPLVDFDPRGVLLVDSWSLGVLVD